MKNTIEKIEQEMSDLRLDIQSVFDANDTHLLQPLRARLSGLQTALDICIEADVETTELTVDGAKAFLKEKSYYTDNLWTVEDVQSKYDCTDEEAQEVLDGALQNEATMEQIWFAINFHAEEEGLKAKGNFGDVFSIGDSVEVPDPDDSDIHNHSFVGTIVGFKGNEYAVVEDGDCNCFDIEFERLTLI